MKAYFIVCFLLITSFVLADNESIHIWNNLTFILQDGSEALLKQIREDRTPAPLIHSKWYVDERIAKEFPDTVGNENAKREFGRAWLVQLEEESRTLRALTTNEEREAKARTLLDLADWIGSEEGYGNLWLFYRLQDLANIPIGYLLSDNDYPMSSLEQMVPRLRDNMGIFTLIGIPALNSEAPEPLFKAGEVNFNSKKLLRENEEDFRVIKTPSIQIWQQKYQEISAILKKGEDAGDLTGAEQRSLVPENLQFFIDDSNDKSFHNHPFTALGHWDDKFHYKFVLGLVGSKVKSSLALFKFRQKVGKIPAPVGFSPKEIAEGEELKKRFAKNGQKIVLFWEDPNFDGYEQSFRDAWRAVPGIPANERDLDADAYMIFKLVRGNKLYDDDYEETFNWNSQLKKKQLKEIKKQEEKQEEEREKQLSEQYHSLFEARKKANDDLWPLIEQYEITEKELAISRDFRLYEEEQYANPLRMGQINEANNYAAKKRSEALEWINDPACAKEYEKIARKIEEAIKKDVELDQKLQRAATEYKEYRSKRNEERIKRATNL